MFLVGPFGPSTHGFLKSALAQDIVILKSADIAAYKKAITAFKANLPNSVTNITEYDLRGDIAQGRKLGRKLRASNATLVLAVGLKATLVAKLEILDIPVIYCMVLNPDKYDLHSQNMTGIELQIPSKRQLTTMQMILPAMKRVGVVFDPTKTAGLVQEAQRYAPALGLKLVTRPVASERDVPETVRGLLPNIDALWLLPDSTVLTEDSLDFLLSSTLEAGLPVIGFSTGLVRSGALVGLYVKYEDVGAQAAELATKIIRSETIPKATAIPLKHTRLAINQKVADFLEIEILPSLMRQADEVF